MNEYSYQTLIRLTLNVIDGVTGNLVDTSSISASVQDDRRIIADVTGAIVHDSTGKYHLDYLPPSYGEYKCKWVCAGSVQATYTDIFFMKRPFE